MWVHAELDQNIDLHHQYIIVLEGFGLFGQREWTPKWYLEMYLTRKVHLNYAPVEGSLWKKAFNHEISGEPV